MRFRFIILILGFIVALPLWAKKKKNDPDKPEKLSKTTIRLGRIQSPEIAESSGVAASFQHTNVFWTHNDGKKGPKLFAITRTGEVLGSHIIGVKLHDWEDVAVTADGKLFIADTGNNDLKRKTAIIYQF